MATMATMVPPPPLARPYDAGNRGDVTIRDKLYNILLLGSGDRLHTIPTQDARSPLSAGGLSKLPSCLCAVAKKHECPTVSVSRCLAVFVLCQINERESVQFLPSIPFVSRDNACASPIPDELDKLAEQAALGPLDSFHPNPNLIRMIRIGFRFK